MKKYYSAVLAVFKNEAHIIREWVEHYKNRNIDHIYLLNDFSTDNFKEQIDDYIRSGYVTLRDVDSNDVNDGITHGRQCALYNKYFSDVLEETEWLAVLDLDEFLYSPKTKDLNEVFMVFDNTNVQELRAEWYHFGSSGLIKQPKRVVENFIMRNEKFTRDLGLRQQVSGYQTDWCCKTVAKTKFISYICHHYNHFNCFGNKSFESAGFNLPHFSQNLSDPGTLLINHYLQSWERYKKRIELGSCNNNRYIHRSAALYEILNRNEIVDTRLRDQG